MKYTIDILKLKIIQIFPHYNTDNIDTCLVTDKIKLVCNLHETCFLQTVRETLKGQVACIHCNKNRNKTQSFLIKSKTIHGNIYDYSLVDYKTNNDKVKIICKNHGIFEQRPRTHLSGHGCNNCSKENTLFKKGTVLNLNKRIETQSLKSLENFKLKLEENKSKYKYLEINLNTFKNLRDKTLEVTCKEHGKFIIRPNNLLSNLNGCPKCTEQLNGHSLTNFKEICKRKNKDKAILYILEVYSEVEKFYKIGITSNTIKQRYSSKSKLSKTYNYRVIQEIHDDPETIWKAEKLLLKMYQDYHYIPNEYFNGCLTECFKSNTQLC